CDGVPGDGRRGWSDGNRDCRPPAPGRTGRQPVGVRTGDCRRRLRGRCRRMRDVMAKTRYARTTSERGQALIEVALTLPLVLLVAVGIFEFGRAYQTWQILPNVAREGARVAVTPSGE